MEIFHYLIKKSIHLICSSLLCAKYNLFDLIPQANVVCVVYDVTAEESLERVCVSDDLSYINPSELFAVSLSTVSIYFFCYLKLNLRLDTGF